MEIFDGASPKNCLNMHSAIHLIFTTSEDGYDNPALSFCHVKEYRLADVLFMMSRFHSSSILLILVK